MGKVKYNYTKEDAKEFAEGNKTLETILCYCLDNNFSTNACCAGHFHNSDSVMRPYISFLLTPATENFLAFALEHKLLQTKQIETSLVHIDYPNLKKSTISFYLANNSVKNLSSQEFNTACQSFFENIEQTLLKYQKQSVYSPKLELLKILKSKYCRFELDFVDNNLQKMYIENPTIVKIDGFEAEKTEKLIIYNRKSQSTLQDVKNALCFKSDILTR